MKTTKLTKEEQEAVSALQRLADKWPQSLWLFSGSGRLHVMKCKPNGERAYTSRGGTDPDYQVTHVEIPNDGGDW